MRKLPDDDQWLVIEVDDFRDVLRALEDAAEDCGQSPETPALAQDAGPTESRSGRLH